MIAAGFGIFALSNFPPTQRFGLVVLAGTIVDILSNLFVLPLLGGADLRLLNRGVQRTDNPENELNESQL